ncbi:MAG: O-antigen ligase family protein [Gammaproteobacteria bacterium]
MGLSPILFLLTWVAGIGATLFVSAEYGLYSYLIMFHMSPEHTWWGRSVPDLRYLMIVGLLALARTATRKDPHPGEPWHRMPIIRTFIIFNVWLWLINLWALSPLLHRTGCILYFKHLIIVYITYSLCKDNLEVIKRALLVIVVGCGWFGWQAMGKSGRVEGVAGAIADANTLGMHSATGVIIGSMMILGFRNYYRWVPFACMPLVLNLVVLAGSRGGFLGLVSGGLVAMFFCPRSLKRRFKLLGALGVVLFLMLAHDQFIDRLTGLFDAAEGEEELDGSASSRLVIAAAGWRMALDRPLGAGHKGHAILSPYYLDESYLTGGGRVGEEKGRSAHNSFMSAIVEYGFPGVFMYGLMYILAGFALLRLRRFAAQREDVELGIVVAATAAGLTVVFVAGQFSSYVYAENQFWLFAICSALVALTRRQAATEAAAVPDAMAGEVGHHGMIEAGPTAHPR